MKEDKRMIQNDEEYMITKIGEEDGYYSSRGQLIGEICYPINVKVSHWGRMYGKVRLKKPRISSINPCFADFNMIKRRDFLLPGLKYPKRLEKSEMLPYITTYTSTGGPKAVLLKWDDELGFYEPWNTSPRMKNMEQARSYARGWAEAEGIEYWEGGMR